MKIKHLFRNACINHGLSLCGLLTVLMLCAPATWSQQRSRVVVRTRQPVAAQSSVPVNNTQNRRTQPQAVLTNVFTEDFDFSVFEQKYYTEIPDPPNKENMTGEEYLRYLQEQAKLLKNRSNPAQNVQNPLSGNLQQSRSSADTVVYAAPTNRRVNESNKTGFVSPRPEILSIERKVFELVNARRRQYGLQSVIWSDTLEQAARRHSENMGINHFFSHIDLDGANVRDRVNKFDLGWTGLGENLALNYGGKNLVEQVVEQWMNSSAHRDNMLKATWTQSAVGVYIDGKGQYYFTQVFLKN
jgi:uncharacterized protein YkwD